MPIPMPSISDLPDGPHRQLLLAVHQLYRDAGKPGIHHTSKMIRARNDLRDTISHEAISKILRGEVTPRRWQKLEALIQQYLDWSADRPGPSECAAAVRKIQTLWHHATDVGNQTTDTLPAGTGVGVAATEGATTNSPGPRPRMLVYPEAVAIEAMHLPDEKARDFIVSQTRRPDRELIALVAALMPMLPDEGIRLLHLVGITYDIGDDPYIADVVEQVQRYPTESWHGHDPLRALLRNVGKRSDYGVHLIETLIERNNTAAVQGYLKVYAERTSAMGAAELVCELAKTRSLRPVVNQFLRTVSAHMPRPLAQKVPEQLRQVGRDGDAQLMAVLLTNS
ncbi:hypothetical protein [Streptomyces scopuliridis]|uniref:hypothetical protein n=1 Tax=Streptomyces scopuliridis TaxID=452529 RepID=UPI0036C4C55A